MITHPKSLERISASPGVVWVHARVPKLVVSLALLILAQHFIRLLTWCAAISGTTMKLELLYSLQFIDLRNSLASLRRSEVMPSHWSNADRRTPRHCGHHRDTEILRLRQARH